ncbi:MAG: O-antigen ligase family protein [Pseudomonadota bacterium]
MERVAEKYIYKESFVPREKESSQDTYWFVFACIILGLAFFLDAPWGRAFYDYTPITETLGALYFSSFSDTLGIPGVSVTPFELISLILAGGALSKIFRLLPDDTAKNIFVAMLASLALLFFAGITSGWGHGNDSRVMLTQVRAIISLPLWLIIGAAFFTSQKRAWIFLSIIASATFVKSLQGLWSFLYILERRKGTQEYIVEHITSCSIVTAWVAFNALIWLKERNLFKKIFLSITANSVLGFVFLVNDRRAALVGLVMGLALLFVSLPLKFYRRHFLGMLGALLMGVLYLAATWETSGALGFPARAIKSLTDPSESSSGYRQVENANLLFSIANAPLTGIGFGKRFPIVFPLPNIASIYSEYDLIPHNTLLFVWTFAGPLGIAGLGTFFALSIGLALRMFRRSPSLEGCLLGGIAVLVFVQTLSYIYADIGLREVRLLAEAGGVAGYLIALSPLGLKEGNT